MKGTIYREYRGDGWNHAGEKNGNVWCIREEGSGEVTELLDATNEKEAKQFADNLPDSPKAIQLRQERAVNNSAQQGFESGQESSEPKEPIRKRSDKRVGH